MTLPVIGGSTPFVPVNSRTVLTRTQLIGIAPITAAQNAKEDQMLPKIIFDVGLHIGQDTEFYLKKGYKVIAIEANQFLVSQALKRFSKQVVQNDLIVLNYAISDSFGVAQFYINNDRSEWSSLEKELGSRESSFRAVEVQTCTLSSIMDTFGTPYYVKIDIEGCDLMALRQIAMSQHRPKYISVENGQKAFLDVFLTMGYDRFKFVNQAEVPNVNLSNPPLEGEFIQFKFPFGSSGPFGEEAPGEWLTSKEVEHLIDAYWSRPDRDPNIHGWYDLHAQVANSTQAAQ